MSIVLITGLSGSGKSAVYRRLVELGYEAVGFDEDRLGEWVDRRTGVPVDFPTERHGSDGTDRLAFTVHRERLEELAHRSRGRIVYLCGGAGHEFGFWELLDRVVYLAVDDDTLRHRLAARTDNGYGKTAAELDGILDANTTFADSYRARGAHVVDGARPLDQVVGDVIAIGRGRRLIMVAGSSPGAGKSTLMRRLADHCRSTGIHVRTIDEDDAWGSRALDGGPGDPSTGLPAFRRLLRTNGSTDVTAADVLATFDEVIGGAPDESMCVQDWTWLDLAAHLPWAESDPSAFDAFADELRVRAAPLTPALLYLRVDTRRAAQRASDERGRRWHVSHAALFTTVPASEVSVESVASFYRQQEDRRRRRLTAGGWQPIVIDGDAEVDDVVADAVRALGLLSSR